MVVVLTEKHRLRNTKNDRGSAPTPYLAGQKTTPTKTSRQGKRVKNDKRSNQKETKKEKSRQRKPRGRKGKNTNARNKK